MITCIIPAYNEQKNISRVISVAKAAKEKGMISSVLVVSDGSKDKTAEAAREAGVEVIEIEKNRGKGNAILEGLRKVETGDVLLLDADLIDLKVEHIEYFIEEAKREDISMVIGFLSEDRGQQILPQLSGQRYLKRLLIDKIITQKWEKSRFNIEILMNRLATELKFQTVLIPLKGLGHLKKESKYSHPEAYYQKFLASMGFANIYKSILFALMMTILIANLGLIIFTPLRPKQDSLGEMPAVVKNDRILIIVAHPDDEMIGSGGFMADAAKAGAEVSVAVATCGDANKFSAGVIDKKLVPKKSDFVNEGQIRTAESEKALRSIGVKKFYYLGFPDRNLNQLLTTNWDSVLTSKYTGFSKNEYSKSYKPETPYKGSELLSEIKQIIETEKPNIVISHLKEDTNKDHQAVIKFTSMAVGELENREIVSDVNIYGFLVHYEMSEYPRPYRKATDFNLNPPKKLLHKCSWKSYPLSKNTQQKKEKALRDYKSQLSSPFLKNLIEALDRKNELYCPLS